MECHEIVLTMAKERENYQEKKWCLHVEKRKL